MTEPRRCGPSPLTGLLGCLLLLLGLRFNAVLSGLLFYLYNEAPTPRPHPGHTPASTSATPRPHLGCTSATLRPHFGQHLGHTPATPRPHFGHTSASTSAAPRLHPTPCPYDEVSTRALRHLSGVGHSVANTAKRAVVIVGSAVAFGEQMDRPKAVGCAIAIAGTFLYAIADDIPRLGGGTKRD